MTFAARLREEREALGASRRALARAAGVDEGLIRRYEAGMEPVHAGALRIARALEIEIYDLIAPGSGLFDVEFPRAGKLAGLAAVVSPWPDLGDGRQRVRVRAGGLPVVLGHADRLGAPVVTPVVASPDLSVMVQAAGRVRARAAVLTETTRAQCCPRVDLERRGDLWAARLRGVPGLCSLRLQRLRETAPLGLFVPVLL